MWGEFDGLVERVISTHPANAMLLVQAAASYQSASHSGRLVAGEFERGGGPRYGRRSMGPDDVPDTSAGGWVNTFYRDQVRSFQLFRDAVGKSKNDAERYRAWEDCGADTISVRSRQPEAIEVMAQAARLN